jgi:hypothetical protein
MNGSSQRQRPRVCLKDWLSWHNKYNNPNSQLAGRLRTVQIQIRAILDDSPSGPLSVIVLCAGQGQDLLEVLVDHPRRDDVRARLVELDERNAEVAEEKARASGLRHVQVITGDASLADQYLGIAPAHLVLICGVFGNIIDDDIRFTIDSCSQLCRTGGAVIWTRNRRAPDRVPLICEWFKQRGFDLRWLSEQDSVFGVGVHRFTRETQPLIAGMRMFTFVG